MRPSKGSCVRCDCATDPEADAVGCDLSCKPPQFKLRSWREASRWISSRGKCGVKKNADEEMSRREYGRYVRINPCNLYGVVSHLPGQSRFAPNPIMSSTDNQPEMPFLSVRPSKETCKVLAPYPPQDDKCKHAKKLIKARRKKLNYAKKIQNSLAGVKLRPPAPPQPSSDDDYEQLEEEEKKQGLCLMGEAHMDGQQKLMMTDVQMRARLEWDENMMPYCREIEPNRVGWIALNAEDLLNAMDHCRHRRPKEETCTR